MKTKCVIAIWIMTAIMAATCAPAPDGTPPTPPEPAEPTKKVTQPATASPVRPTDSINVAREALAKHADVSVDEVQVVDSTRDVFPIDNLGCPGGSDEDVTRPGMVAGLEVTLQVGDDTYIYRVRGRQAILCKGPETSNQ